MHQILDPKNDAVFKMIFAKKGNEDVLVNLLTTITKAPIGHIKVTNPEIPKKHIDDKGTLLDILVELKTREKINIEMQMNWTSFLEKRAFYYSSRLFSSQLKKGHHYEKLSQTITIFILRDIAFKNASPDRFHYVFSMLERQNAVKLANMMELHFIEINKLFSLLGNNPRT